MSDFAEFQVRKYLKTGRSCSEQVQVSSAGVHGGKFYKSGFQTDINSCRPNQLKVNRNKVPRAGRQAMRWNSFTEDSLKCSAIS